MEEFLELEKKRREVIGKAELLKVKETGSPRRSVAVSKGRAGKANSKNAFCGGQNKRAG